MKITFVPTVVDPTLPEPIPASKKIPEWYKDIPRFIGGAKVPALPDDSQGFVGSTIKTCMPVLDAMTSGYLILSAADVFIRKTEDGFYYQWADHSLISFHNQNQVTGYPRIKEKLKTEKVPKFNNLWIVKTPNGYSSLFVTPFHHELPFTILPAIVDTDSYFNAVNFPFIPDPDFEGLIPKGTPIAQVLPFKREDWNMQVEKAKTKDNERRYLTVNKTLSTQFFDRYKKHFWKAKSYK